MVLVAAGGATVDARLQCIAGMLRQGAPALAHAVYNELVPLILPVLLAEGVAQKQALEAAVQKLGVAGDATEAIATAEAAAPAGDGAASAAGAAASVNPVPSTSPAAQSVALQPQSEAPAVDPAAAAAGPAAAAADSNAIRPTNEIQAQLLAGEYFIADI